MASILSDLKNTIIAGVILTVVLVLVMLWSHDGAGLAFDKQWWRFLFRWLHVLSGVMWIGLLWYFNFVQIPNMSNIDEAMRPAITKVIAEGIETDAQRRGVHAAGCRLAQGRLMGAPMDAEATLALLTAPTTLR